MDGAQNLSREAALARAQSLLRNRPAEALAIYRAFLDGAYGPINDGDRVFGRRFVLKCLFNLKDWTGAEREARIAADEAPKDWRPRHLLGEAFARQFRLDDAREALGQAIALDPHRSEPRNLLKILDEGGLASEPARPIRPWPSSIQKFVSLRKAIRRYILRGRPHRRLIEPESVFLTIGSCFATNLARRLEATGRKVGHEMIGEEVNSTQGNLYLLDWLERGVTDETTAAIDRAFGPVFRSRMTQAIRDADVCILTLGVAATFVHRITGEFAFRAGELRPIALENLLGQYEMRTTGVAENSGNIISIAETLQRITGHPLKLVLTVSPVPLAGTTEMDSAFEADSLSKSTLRVACHEAMQARPDLDMIYWPSFEIVRSVGPYFASETRRLFGAEDGNSRHVSNWIVDVIIDEFLTFYGEEAEFADAPESAPAA